jgi:heme exporter protein D
MSDFLIWLSSGIGLIAIFFLVIKISRSLREIKQENISKQEANKKQLEQRKFLIESMQVLCGSVLDKQVEISEACMRVKLLIDHFDSTLHERADFKVFNDVYDRLEHMPRFEARKRLSKREMNALDQERYEVEAKYEEEVKKACVALLAHLSSLH